MPDPTDDLGRSLAALAPTVDPVASRVLFERSRSQPAPTRWLLPAAVVALLLAGVVGVWAAARDAGDEPIGPVDEPVVQPITEGVATEGDGYETVLVAEAPVPFGRAVLATDDRAYEQAWAELGTADSAPSVDLERSVALVMTRPDDACADTIVRFEVERVDAVPTWTPVFEDLSSACDQPLLSWVYVVALDRAALGAAAVVRVPAADLYDVSEVLLPYESGGTLPPDGAADDEPVLTDTGIRLPLPAEDEPTLHDTAVGLLWLVAHGDGSSSVLPATVDQPASADEGGVTGLRTLVRASATGRTFSVLFDGLVWDDHGRTISGGRANDLVGFAGRVEGDEVVILTSDADRIDGDPAAPVPNEDYPLPGLPPLIDLPTFATLSSTGPIWRHFDATLVVEDGVGRICEVDDTVAVPDLTTCDDADVALDTTLTSTAPELTSWFHAPILARQDPVDGFVAVVPLGGWSARNEAPFDDSPVIVAGSSAVCGDGGGIVVRVDLEFLRPGSAELVVVDGRGELVRRTAEGSGAMTIELPLETSPGPDARLLVASGASDVTLELPRNPPDCG